MQNVASTAGRPAAARLYGGQAGWSYAAMNCNTQSIAMLLQPDWGNINTSGITSQCFSLLRIAAQQRANIDPRASKVGRILVLDIALQRSFDVKGGLLPTMLSLPGICPGGFVAAGIAAYCNDHYYTIHHQYYLLLLSMLPVTTSIQQQYYTITTYCYCSIWINTT